MTPEAVLAYDESRIFLLGRNGTTSVKERCRCTPSNEKCCRLSGRWAVGDDGETLCRKRGGMTRSGGTTRCMELGDGVLDGEEIVHRNGRPLYPLHLPRRIQFHGLMTAYVYGSPLLNITPARQITPSCLTLFELKNPLSVLNIHRSLGLEGS